MKPRSIHLDIDSIVLRGIDPGDREAFAAALHTELLALLSNADVASTLGESRARARADGGRIDARSSQRGLAPAVARAVWRGVSR